MDKGIRQGLVRKFQENLQVVTPEQKAKFGRGFRRTLLDWAVAEFACTMAAASTHYNFAKDEAEKVDPTISSWLGRPPEKNNGGRKKKVAAVVETPAADSAVVGDVTTSNILGNDTGEAGEETPAGDGSVLLSEGIKENTSEHTVTTNPDLVTVVKASDGSVVAEGIERAQAEELIAKAKAAKKATLKIA